MREVENYKDIKICCYGMGASEPEAFIDRWLDSMSGADYVTYLVTKKNDPNFTYLKEKQKEERFKNKLIIDEEDIIPWRFDVARNESMKLIPEDSDILICTDIDEVLIEDFWDDYRKCAFEHPDFNRIYYRYAWSVNSETGEPGVVYWYDKASQAKGWKWECPVHETLTCDTDNYHYEGTYRLDGDKIYLYHYPDASKSRASYLGLLELRVKEDKEDIYGLYYLMREYTFRGSWDKALVAGTGLYQKILAGDSDGYHTRADGYCCLIAYVCNYLGRCYYNLGLRDEACYFFRKGIEFDKTKLNNYVDLAQTLVYMGKGQEALDVMTEKDQSVVLTEDWRDDTFYRKEWKKYQILSGAYCWIGDFKKAREYAEEGEKYVVTADDKRDADKKGFFSDMGMIKRICAERGY